MNWDQHRDYHIIKSVAEKYKGLGYTADEAFKKAKEDYYKNYNKK